MRSETHRNLRSGDVIVRFCLRIAILVAFAAFADIGFSRSLSALLWMSIILSTIFAAIRREPLLDAVLNHWDEAAAYAALYCLLSSLSQTAAV